MIVNFVKTSSGLELVAGDRSLGKIESFCHDSIRAEDELNEVEPGLFAWTRSFQATAPVEKARLTLDFTLPRPLTFGLIPAVSYNGNPWGPGQDIKGFSSEGQPWTFAYHRVAVAGATYSENEEWSVALFAKEGFKGSCALVLGAGKTIHRLIVPEAETPQVYILRDQYTAPYEAVLSMQAGETIAVTAYLLVRPVEEPRQAWREMLDVAWKQHHYKHQPRHSGEELWRWGLDFASESLWSEEGPFRGFCIGLHWRDASEKWERSLNTYEIGWCGQNASLANALLADYLRKGKPESLEKGLAVLDAWAELAPLPNGLFRCHFEHILRPSEGKPEVQDGCNLGAAAVYFFEAFQLAQKCGVGRPNYRAVALAICDFFEQHQFPDGNLGRAWTNDGVCVSTDGSTGGFLIPPLLTAYQLTGRESLLQTARKAFDYYFRGLLENGFTAAGALDTHCIDKESAIPLFKSALLLYEITAEPAYLKQAEHAAYYLSTWQWHHSVEYPANTELNRLAYDTFGGTSVSTQHHHQDPYGLVYVADLLKLAELTGKPTWKERAQAIWANGMIGVSDGTLVVAGKLRPTGSQDEGFYHTRWGHWPFNTSRWLVAWPTAFRLEVLRSLPDWAALE